MIFLFTFQNMCTSVEENVFAPIRKIIACVMKVVVCSNPMVCHQPDTNLTRTVGILRIGGRLALSCNNIWMRRWRGAADETDGVQVMI